ncbi:MAG: peptidoglycan-binding protein [Gammaproteobacteria bacterium]|nr:peptidoglycan-binding protein [Gammaproteobacteria bacterium]
MKTRLHVFPTPLIRLLLIALLASVAVGCGGSDSTDEDPGIENPEDEEPIDEEPIDEEPIAQCDGDSNVSGNHLTAWTDNCILNFQNSDGSPGPASTSSYTKGVQRILWCLNYDDNVENMDVFADGVFGRATENAVIAFQEAESLGADGVVGPNTWGRLQDQLLLSNLSDADNNWWEIDSARCAGDVHFYQAVAEPQGWMMEDTPTDQITEMVPFSIGAP